MAGDNETRPTPVEGVVIPASALKSTAIIVVAIILMLVFAGIFFAILAGEVGEGRPVTKVFLLIFSPVIVLASPGLIFLQLRSLWRRRRLIVGSNCLQIVETRGGGDTVVLHIPYENVADLAYVPRTEYGIAQLRIELHRMDDPLTFSEWPQKFQSNKEIFKCHYAFDGGLLSGYRASLSSIHDEIRRAIANSGKGSSKVKE